MNPARPLPLMPPRAAIAVYGPPGAGKSTLIATAIRRGLCAVDLEATGIGTAPRDAALAAIQRGATTTLVGAADATPEDFPVGTWFVLLAPPPEELERRVRARGDRREQKWVLHALQVRDEHLAMAEAGCFDLVVRAVESPDQVLDRILAAAGLATPDPGTSA